MWLMVSILWMMNYASVIVFVWTCICFYFLFFSLRCVNLWMMLISLNSISFFTLSIFIYFSLPIPFVVSVLFQIAWYEIPGGMIWVRIPMVCRSCGLAGSWVVSVSLGWQFWGLTCHLFLNLTLCWILISICRLPLLICGGCPHAWICAD